MACAYRLNVKGHLRFVFDKQSILDLNLKIPDRDDVVSQGTSNSSEVLIQKHMVVCFVGKTNINC